MSLRDSFMIFIQARITRNYTDYVVIYATIFLKTMKCVVRVVLMIVNVSFYF